VEEKAFKKKQILLDKLSSESRVIDEQANRELDHLIEVALLILSNSVQIFCYFTDMKFSANFERFRFVDM
jgi:hypothetical protein